MIKKIIFVCSTHGEPMIEIVRDECMRRNIELLIVTDSKYLCKIFTESGYKVECLSTSYQSKEKSIPGNSYRCEKKYYFSPDWILSHRSRSIYPQAQKIIECFNPDVIFQRPGGEILRRAFFSAARKLEVLCLTFGEDVFSVGGLVYEGEFKNIVKSKMEIPMEDLIYGMEGIVLNDGAVSNYSSPVKIKKNRVKKLFTMISVRDYYVIWTYVASIISNKLIARARSVLADFLIYRKIENSKRYYFLPLNVEAESELHVRNPFSLDQYLLCKSVLGFISEDYNLVVKEHPGAQKSLSFYKMLKLRLSGVYFVKSSLSGRSVVRGSTGVIINSSTVGLEAIAMQKPLLWLGMWPFAKFIAESNANLTERANSFFENPKKFIVNQEDFLRRIKPYVWDGSFYKSEKSFRTILGRTLDDEIFAAKSVL